MSKTKPDGLYVTASLFNFDVNCLIDTGASLSVMHPEKYYKIPEAERPCLEKDSSRLSMANGDTLQSLGNTIINLKFQHETVTQRVIVAEVDAPLVLGYDFLKQHGCVVDIGNATLHMKNKPIKCQLESSMDSIFRITSKETIEIPPRSEMIIEGKILGSLPIYEEAFVEPCAHFCEKKELLVAKAIVNPHGMVPVRVANLSDVPRKIYGNTFIATGQSVANDVLIEPDDFKEASGKISMIQNGEESIPEYMQTLFETSTSNVSEDQKRQVKDLLLKNASIFSSSKNDVGRTKLIQHRIFTGDAAPVKMRPRRLPLAKKAQAEEEIDRMLSGKFIKPSTSPWASPIVLVQKKDGSIRFCIDYRKVNEITRKDSYPLPRIDDSLDALNGSKWFSTLDLSSGYWQVEMHPSDAEKTAFVTSKGLFEFNVMPFGLVNAPATFERLMEAVLAGLHWKICLIYLDDIIVYADDFETHLKRLKEVFNRIKEAGLKLSPKKCKLLQEEVKFLGHIVSESGISTDPEKVRSVEKWPIPRNVSEVRSFLGTCSYYRRFIKGFADIARPLHQLTEKDVDFLWNENCQTAFECLKKALTESPILGYPSASGLYILDTDASGIGIGAVLSQMQDGQERVLAYYSRSLNRAERRYCVTRRELLAVIEAIKNYHHYLYGIHFKIRTDHAALKWLMRFKNPEGQVARWLEFMGTYDFDIEHRPGKKHGNADGLSRRPCSQCRYCERLEEREQLQDCTGHINVVNEVKGNDKESDKDDSSLDKETRLSIHPEQWIESWSPEELQQWQKDDIYLSQVLDWKESDNRPKWQDIQSQGTEIRSLWAEWDVLTLKRGVLYRIQHQEFKPHIRSQLVAPLCIRKDIFKYLHSHRTGGHVGVKKTCASITARFWWPALREDITLWCRKCEPCQFRKSRTGLKKSPLCQSPVGSPMERIGIDILSLTTETEDGNVCVLVVSDYFTKWTQAIALPDHTALTVADALVVEVFLKFGTPRLIHSDQGAEFQSELIKEIYRLLEIKQTRTAPYHPQSDGQVERFNRTLLDMLAKLCAENPETWDHHLPYVMCAYRATVHESTGCSPNLLMLGREINLPIDLLLGNTNEELPYNCSIQYVQWVREAMLENFELVRQKLKRSAEKQKQYYDKRALKREFQVGDWVLRLYPPNITKNKLHYKNTGPYLVIKKMGEVNYMIQKGKNTPKITVHVNDLKNYEGENVPNNWLNSTSQTPETITGHDIDFEHESRSQNLENLHDDPITYESSFQDESLNLDEDKLPTRKGGRIRRPPRRFGWED